MPGWAAKVLAANGQKQPRLSKKIEARASNWASNQTRSLDILSHRKLRPWGQLLLMVEWLAVRTNLYFGLFPIVIYLGFIGDQLVMLREGFHLQ